MVTTIRPRFAVKCITATAVLFVVVLSALEGMAEEWGSCQPIQVMVFPSRVHVKCKIPLVDPDAPHDAISYFAYPTSDAPAAERILSTLLSAQVANRTLTVLYNLREHSELARTIGCQWSDCRLMSAVGFGQ